MTILALADARRISEEEARMLLELRVRESGLSLRKFAMEVLLREYRTVKRWRSGDSPIPMLVREWLANPKRSPWP